MLVKIWRNFWLQVNFSLSFHQITRPKLLDHHCSPPWVPLIYEEGEDVLFELVYLHTWGVGMFSYGWIGGRLSLQRGWGLCGGNTRVFVTKYIFAQQYTKQPEWRYKCNIRPSVGSGLWVVTTLWHAKIVVNCCKSHVKGLMWFNGKHCVKILLFLLAPHPGGF